MVKNTFPKIKLMVVTLLILFIFSIINSFKKASDVPGTNEVWIQDMAFKSSAITVSAGTTITWTNKDGVAHTVTSNIGLFDSGSINNNGIYSHMFSTGGTFQYNCTFHPTMTASVIVN